MRLCSSTLLTILLTILVGVLPASARRTLVNKSAGQGRVEWHKVADHSKKGLRCQVTDGYHEISGWEKQVVKRDPNLRHWTWIPMLEANRAYIKVAPGYRPAKAGIDEIPVASHYIKPRRLHPGTKVAHGSRPRIYAPAPCRIVEARPTERLYVKPVHVATICQSGTGINLSHPNASGKLTCSSPNTAITASAPQTTGHLQSRNANGRLRTLQTNGRPRTDQISSALKERYISSRLGAPKTNATLGSPAINPLLSERKASSRIATGDVQGRLDSKQVNARLSAPEVKAQLASAQAYGCVQPEDIFCDDSAESAMQDAYRSRSVSRGSSVRSTCEQVHGQVMPSSPRSRYY